MKQGGRYEEVVENSTVIGRARERGEGEGKLTVISGI